LLPFPSQEVDPTGAGADFDVASARAACCTLWRPATHARRGLRPRAHVAGEPSDRLARASIEVAPGDDLSPLALTDLLGDAGFTREDPVDEHGEFCVRGGVVDLFRRASATLRLEFIGDNTSSRSAGSIQRRSARSKR